MSSIKYKAKFQQELNELYPMGKKKEEKNMNRSGSTCSDH